MAKNIEIRNITNEIRRADTESRKVEGLAVVFNSESRDMGFIETIDKILHIRIQKLTRSNPNYTNMLINVSPLV